MSHRWSFAAFAPGVVAVLLLGTVGAGCGGDDDDGAGEGGKEGPEPRGPMVIGEVETYDDHLLATHVDKPVEYRLTPPVGGPHWQAWQDCGFYDQPVRSEAAVHSMEHGAVWITYRPDLPADQVEQIRALAEQPYVLASPWEDDSLPAPIVLSAWGAQLGVRSLPSPGADTFLTAYREGSSAPEPGAPCTGGLAVTAAEAEAEGLVDSGGH